MLILPHGCLRSILTPNVSASSPPIPPRILDCCGVSCHPVNNHPAKAGGFALARQANLPPSSTAGLQPPGGKYSPPRSCRQGQRTRTKRDGPRDFALYLNGQYTKSYAFAYQAEHDGGVWLHEQMEQLAADLADEAADAQEQPAMTVVHLGNMLLVGLAAAVVMQQARGVGFVRFVGFLSQIVWLVLIALVWLTPESPVILGYVMVAGVCQPQLRARAWSKIAS